MIIAPFCPECGTMMLFRFPVFGCGGNWYCDKCGYMPKTIATNKTEVEG